MNYFLRFSSLCALLSFTLFSQVVYSQGTLEKELDSDESFTSFGRWVKEGEAITEFPVCYQIWRCESTNQQTLTNVQPKLPKGMWGVCENYLTVSQEKICSKCDAPPPSETCY